MGLFGERKDSPSRLERQSQELADLQRRWQELEARRAKLTYDVPGLEQFKGLADAYDAKAGSFVAAVVAREARGLKPPRDELRAMSLLMLSAHEKHPDRTPELDAVQREWIALRDLMEDAWRLERYSP